MQTATVHYSQTGYVASHPSKATIFVTESVILQHDNAPPHKARQTVEKVAMMGRECCHILRRTQT